MVRWDIEPEVVKEKDIVPGILREREIALENLIERDIAPEVLIAQVIIPEVVENVPEVIIEWKEAPEVVKKREIAPEVLIEREIKPEVVILYTSVEEDTFQERVQLYTKTTKFQAKSDDTFSVSSFGYHYDQQFSNDSIQTIAKDLENVSK